jgi:hypothetical protein
VLAPAQDLENELVALLAVLPEQRLDVFEGRGFERLESVPLVHVADDADDVFTPSDFVRKKIAGSARWFRRHWLWQAGRPALRQS